MADENFTYNAGDQGIDQVPDTLNTEEHAGSVIGVPNQQAAGNQLAFSEAETRLAETETARAFVGGSMPVEIVSKRLAGAPRPFFGSVSKYFKKFGCISFLALIILYGGWLYLEKIWNNYSYNNIVAEYLPSSQDKIEAAYERGEINADKYLEQLLFATYENSKLASEYQSNSKIKGDSHIGIIYSRIDMSGISAATKKLFEKHTSSFFRDTGSPKQSSTLPLTGTAYAAESEIAATESVVRKTNNYPEYYAGNLFEMHYSNDKNDLNFLDKKTTKRYIAAAEKSLNYYVNNGMIKNPIKTNPSWNRGRDNNKIPIYLVSGLDEDVLGTSFNCDIKKPIVERVASSCSDYIQIDVKNLSKESSDIETTIAHELYHQVQASQLLMPAYTSSSAWEPYAQWMSGIVYDDSNSLPWYLAIFIRNSSSGLSTLLAKDEFYQYCYFNLIEYVKVKYSVKTVLDPSLQSAENLPKTIMGLFGDKSGSNFNDYGKMFLGREFSNDSFNFPQNESKYVLGKIRKISTIKDNKVIKKVENDGIKVDSTIPAMSFQRYLLDVPTGDFQLKLKQDDVGMQNLYYSIFSLSSGKLKYISSAVMSTDTSISRVDVGVATNLIIQVSNGDGNKEVKYSIRLGQNIIGTDGEYSCKKVGTYSSIFDFFGQLTTQLSGLYGSLADLNASGDLKATVDGDTGAATVALRNESAVYDKITKQLATTGSQQGDNGILMCGYPVLSDADEEGAHSKIFEKYGGFKKTIFGYSVLDSEKSPNDHVSAFSSYTLKSGANIFFILTNYTDRGQTVDPVTGKKYMGVLFNIKFEKFSF